MQAFHQELAAASAEWVKRWPDEPYAWMQRLQALSQLTSTSDAELEHVGDTLLHVTKEHPPKGVSFVPWKTRLATVWSSRKIRLEQCLELTREAAREEQQTQIDNPFLTRQMFPLLALTMVQTLSLEMDIARELKKFDVAESALDEMRRYIEAHPDIPASLRTRYFVEAASLAQAKNHKPDALLYYSQAFQQSPEDTSTEQHAFQLWKELGGTEEGFNAWKATLARMNRPPASAVPSANSPWVALDKPLADFHGKDANGNIWTIDKLKGRKTLIVVWASWCRPCHEELPTVQELFNDLKNRGDVQVLTVSVDEKPEAVRPLLDQKHYTFPIVFLSLSAVDKMAGIAGIPRTWIVDSAGTLRLEAVGYSQAVSRDRILTQLASVN